MQKFLGFCGVIALVAYALTVAIGLEAAPKVYVGNPLFLLCFISAYGLSRIIEVLEQMRDRLDGWKDKDARVQTKGDSVLELLEQIRDKP